MKTISITVAALALTFASATFADYGNKSKKQATPTADAQSNAPADVELTRKIRSSLVEDKTLSTNAHNIKVITQAGKVTLVGPVNTMAEKTKVESIAKTVAGTTPVVSNLSVTK